MNTSWVPQFVLVIVPLVTALIAYLTATARLRAAREAPKKHPTLNGYAPMFADLMNRLEQYRRDYEALQIKYATLQERVDGYERRRHRGAQAPAQSAPTTGTTPKPRRRKKESDTDGR